MELKEALEAAGLTKRARDNIAPVKGCGGAYDIQLPTAEAQLAKATRVLLWGMRALAEYASQTGAPTAVTKGYSHFLSARDMDGVRAFIGWLETQLESLGIEKPEEA